MPNMQPEKTKMPEAEPQVRNKNFEEVALGYTAEMAVNEANRCLNCKHRPCTKGCPVGVKIPEFISHIQKGEFLQAADTIKQTNLMPAICGRVCPQENQCEGKCVRGIKGESVAIGRLERFAADYAAAHSEEKAEKPVSNGKKVAVVGSGPSGLTCAGELARKGYEVTVFEALHEAGGVLVYGIPEFRLPKSIVKNEVEGLKKLGVNVRTNYIVGKTKTIDELLEQDGYDAVFVGSGAGLPNFMGIPGEGLNGVYSANEFLTRINLMKAFDPAADTPIMKAKSVAVIGGGNVAMDGARSAMRNGADKVRIVYRRTQDELPARLEEIHHAMEEGVEFLFLTGVNEICGDENGWVTSLVCEKMELGEPDDSGRRRPKATGETFVLDADCVIMAIGNSPNPLISATTEGLETNRHGCIVLKDEEKCLTTRDRIYAGGDIVTGAATVILAMGAGKSAAAAIDEYLSE